MSDKKSKNAKSGNPIDDLDSSQFDADPNEIHIIGDEAQSHLSEVGDELKKAKDEFLYLKAEFENYKRQAIKERSDLLRFGAERLIVDLLEVLDIFDRALETEVTPENFESFKKGVEMTSSELMGTLQRHGVKELAGSGPFDPNVHEAIGSEPTSEVQPGHIHRVLKKAYGLHERVVRPAQVVVAKEKDKGQDKPE